MHTGGLPVSLPSAAMHWDAATAAADPPEEPPGTRSVSHGLHVTYNSLTMCHIRYPQFTIRVCRLLNCWQPCNGATLPMGFGYVAPDNLSTRWNFPYQMHPCWSSQ